MRKFTYCKRCRSTAARCKCESVDPLECSILANDEIDDPGFARRVLASWPNATAATMTADGTIQITRTVNERRGR